MVLLVGGVSPLALSRIYQTFSGEVAPPLLYYVCNETTKPTLCKGRCQPRADGGIAVKDGFVGSTEYNIIIYPHSMGRWRVAPDETERKGVGRVRPRQRAIKDCFVSLE